MKELNRADHDVVTQVKHENDKSKDIVAFINTKTKVKLKVGLRARLDKEFKLVGKKKENKPSKEE